MTLKIYDSLKREKVELKPLKDNQIRLYTCGPTVYNYAHIGNLRTFVFEDLLRRTLKFLGYDVYHVMNLTDVDDKTIKGAIESGLSLDSYTKTYKEAFFDDLEALFIEPAEEYPEATRYVGKMIELIQDLLDKEVAYIGEDGNVFFRIAKFPQYGKLSHICLDQLKIGASERTAQDEYDKESISDFVLWKAYDKARDGEVFWQAPWGKGRPGWHIECSAMAMAILGETIDLHVGGVDNMFPHHENEIAQSEASTGKTFARHWMHSAHLLVEGKKMSKSLGNFYTLRDLLSKGYTGRQVRYILLSAHYKAQLNFTFEGLQAARASLGRIDDLFDRLSDILSHEGEDITPLIETTRQQISQSLADDLNISEALAAVFECIRKVNTLIDQRSLSKSNATDILNFFSELNEVFGIFQKDEEEVIPQEIYDAAVKRKEARAAKNWSAADEMRAFITEKGYHIEDTSSGFKLKKR